MSGQVFRWRKLASGDWLGADGASWFRVAIREETYFVESNTNEVDFRGYFRLEQSLRKIETQIVARGREVEPCLMSLKGLRVLAPKEPEEVFFCFLCTPNNNVERITRMVRVLESYGTPLLKNRGWAQMDTDGKDASEHQAEVMEFPSAERIAAIPEKELRAKNFGYRGSSIPIAAKQLLERGSGWLEGLKVGSYENAHEELCRISGIGPKLADCICLFGLHFTEAVPVDTHLWQAACREYFPEWSSASMTHKRYREIGDLFRAKFGKLAGWAHQYLFLDNMLRRRGASPKSLVS